MFTENTVANPLAAWLTILTNFLANLKIFGGATPPLGTYLLEFTVGF